MTRPNPNDDTTAIWVLLNLSHRHVVGRFEAELKRAGLPNTRWYDVLWALERGAEGEGVRQFELEELSLFDQPNLSRILKRMVEDGLVTQCTAENDGRGRVLHLTDAGRDLRVQMWDVYGGLMLSEIEQKVAPEHLDGLKKGLRDLLPEEWAKTI